MMCIDVDLSAFILFETLHFLGLNVYFLSQVREVFSQYFFKEVSNPLLSLFLLVTSMMQVLGMLDVVPEAPETSLISLDSFFLFALPIGCFMLHCLPNDSVLYFI